MTDALWDRFSGETQAEVDRLVTLHRNVQAIVLLRERSVSRSPAFASAVTCWPIA
ncbi:MULTISPECIES: hypothetical protein [unclassified Streptomyces]|uniref:hypothetical protein n=1 Tax=unclassified Streptomyces TaxID=2593676 RepID=UPI001BEA384D|nr:MULTISPECIES: hypothetical protein [unclassified Streptomyces]MBT2408716.1 hypothetical protein [Streptomyces sp. ISL-21]MBT2460037.1 hypothetical protein [Streptomyces sp. ISL-86]MBT2612044.1 hypothetical protein [Streptomyces sp. ISL-87]